jgi:hypothetical protein
MKKYGLSILAFCVLFITGFGHVYAEKIDYAKYGNIAMAVARADFPGAPVTEYEFLGREKVNETDVQDSFKFQLKENGKPVTLIIRVKHSIKNNKLLSLTVEEAKQ